jgi:hypothetical protein
MKIVFQNRMGETITRECRVGQKLVGLRLTQVIFENSRELYDLTTEQGQRWLKGNAHRVMRYVSDTPVTVANSPVMEGPVESNLTDNRRESNWGSDWVDDGV